jgi:uncharacterized 2Fe-2S/4Fe-4S cluster protein (DUF4445 family)
MTYKIEFEPIGIRLICEEPLTVYEAARQAGVTLHSVCGGNGTCGKCAIRIREGFVPPPVEFERETLSDALLAEGWRLACRIMPTENTTVYIPAELLKQAQVLQTDGVETAFVPKPSVRLLQVAVDPPSLSDQVSDLQRLVIALQRQHQVEGVKASLPALQAMRPALRTANWKISVALKGDEIISVYPTNYTKPVGLAVDIGTTKLACYLVDLESGRVLAVKGVANPQIAYGEDIMSRLEAVLVDPINAEHLQDEVVTAINAVAEDLCASQGFTPGHLLDLCLVGNTAMHHLLTRLPAGPLALSPFVPALSTALDADAAQLGLRAAPAARVYLPAPIAGFVGSDHLAFLLASGFGEDQRVRLGIDIGTNTEIALQVGNRIVSCSTASGPAFEGAHIRHGMRAAPGAIQHVEIAPDGSVTCDIIGGVPPVGICGSGILDALAEMRKVRLLNERGRMQAAFPGVAEAQDGKPVFTLMKGADGTRSATISQEDIDQILLAKGAIRTGIDVLMDTLKVASGDIEEIIIAGAFGTYLNPLNAVRIGLLPQVPLERIHAVGNAAGTGARMLLASTDCRQQAESLARRVEYLELTIVPGFNKYFAKGIRLPVL